MTGWLLIFSLLVLGGILSTLGDRLGSRVGKARLSILNLRPKRTAVVITVMTGSLISALSLGLMLLVSRQLRMGLFQLDTLQAKINSAQQELRQKENNLIALRRGEVVLRSGQPLVTVTFKLDSPSQSKSVVDRLLQQANLEVFRRVRPGEKPNRQMLLVPRDDIERLKVVIRKQGTWVVSVRSAANVLLGESQVYAFPEVRANERLVVEGEVLARTILQRNERSSELVRKRIRLLLASTFAEVKRRGSLSSGLEFDANLINELGKSLLARAPGRVGLEAVAIQNSDTADSVSVMLKINALGRENSNKDSI